MVVKIAFALFAFLCPPPLLIIQSFPNCIERKVQKVEKLSF